MTARNHEDQLKDTDVSPTPDQTGQTTDGPPRSASNVVIRGAVGDDLTGVLSVGHRTWLATYEPIAGPEYVAMGLAKWWTSDVVTDSIRKGRTLVAVDGEEVVGVATFSPRADGFALWKLYVLPGHHGHGIGSRLMDAVVERVREADQRRITLSYLDGNEQAARFYGRHGFVETHRETPGSGLPESVWMVRELDGQEPA